MPVVADSQRESGVTCNMVIYNLQDVQYNNEQCMALLKEIEARYFYLFHDCLNYDTIDDKSYEALLHLGELINPNRLRESCKNVHHIVTKFHIDQKEGELV